MGLVGPPNVEKLKKKGNIKGLIKALGYRKDWNVRESVAEALGEIGDICVLQPLTIAIDDKEGNVRKSAAEALVKLRLAAVRALGDNYDANSLNAAQDILRLIVTLFEHEIGDARVVDLLSAALNETTTSVVIAAVRVLGNIGDVRAVEPLIAALNNSGAIYAWTNPLWRGASTSQYEVTSVQREVAEALVKIGDARAISLLKLLVQKTSSQDVRDAANRILRELNGKLGHQEGRVSQPR